MKFCDEAFQLAALTLQLMTSEERAKIRPMGEDQIAVYSNCPEMLRICQAGDLVHSCELWMDHEHDENEDLEASVLGLRRH